MLRNDDDPQGPHSGKVRRLPLLPLRDIIVFPHMVVPLFVGREKSIAALDEAMAHEREILLSAQKKAKTNEPTTDDIFAVGTLGVIIQLLRLPDGTVKVLVEGKRRARIRRFTQTDGFFLVEAEEISEPDPRDDKGAEIEALLRSIHGTFETYVKLNKRIPPEMLISVQTIDDPARLADTIVAHLSLKLNDKQAILEMESPAKRLEKLFELMQAEIEILQVEKKIRTRVKKQMEKTQKEYYLNEQMQAIQKELGERDEFKNEIQELEEKIKNKRMSKEAQLKVRKELKKLKMMSPMSAEATVVRNYIDWVLSLPWEDKTQDKLDVTEAERILDEDHYGLKKVKERILEYLAVQALVKKLKGNPVFLLDEVDKMSTDFRGDPSAALLEVLDPEQNNTFQDHYLDLDYDLSDVMFITTANSLHAIPGPLQDRMEIIQLPGYTEWEKLAIAEKYLIVKQKEANGIADVELELGEDGIRHVIHHYTKEAGVRNLEREISTICRKVAKEVVRRGKDGTKYRITTKNVAKYLGVQKYRYSKKEEHDDIGLTNGLAVTMYGGDLLATEVSVVPGKGKLVLTGKLGEVMQESAQAAMSYVRSRAESLGLDREFYQRIDTHVHFPEGAIPKDGPSAGITMATSLVSALLRIPVRRDIAMTGEITLRGRVLPIGGLKDKILAAHRSDIFTVIIPKENKKDLKDIPKRVLKVMKIYPVEHMDEVLRVALAHAEPDKFLPEPSEPVDWRTEPRRVPKDGPERREDSGESTGPTPTHPVATPAPGSVMRDRP